jgi:hypothetical protein
MAVEINCIRMGLCVFFNYFWILSSSLQNKVKNVPIFKGISANLKEFFKPVLLQMEE